MSPTGGDIERFWQQSADLCALLDADGSIERLNDAWPDKLSCDSHTLHGSPIIDLLHPDDRPMFDAQLTALGQAPGTTALDARIRAANGRYLEVHGHLQTLETTHGQVSFIAHDVTDQRRAHAAADAASEYLHQVMDTAPIGMVLADLHGRAQVVNRAMCTLLRRDRDDLIGRAFEEVVHPDDVGLARQGFETLASGDDDSPTFEIRLIHGQGHTATGQVTGSVIRNAGGQPVYLLGQIVDVTQRIQTEAELRLTVAQLERKSRAITAANQELEHFAAVAAHDLRAPLTTVHTALETLLIRPATPMDDRDRELITRSLDNTAQLLENVEGLLALASYRTKDIDRRPVELQVVLQQALDSIGPDLVQVDATISSGPLPTVAGDPAMLRILFQNLLDNAVKFRDPDTPLHVRVSADRRGPHWEVSVTDNGIGLADEDPEHIFELFGRTTDGRKRAGAGIGLATCRKIVELHGGTIQAQPVSNGTRFVAALPAEGSVGTEHADWSQAT